MEKAQQHQDPLSASGPVPLRDLHRGVSGKPQAALSEETYLITAATMLTAKSMGFSELPTYNQGSSARIKNLESKCHAHGSHYSNTGPQELLALTTPRDTAQGKDTRRPGICKTAPRVNWRSLSHSSEQQLFQSKRPVQQGQNRSQ